MRFPTLALLLALNGCGESSRSPDPPNADPPKVASKLSEPEIRDRPARDPVACRRAGYFSHDDLPDHSEQLQAVAAAEIKFENVTLASLVFPSVGSVVTGQITNTSRESLPEVRLTLVRCSRSPDGRWIAEPGVTALISIVAAEKRIGFRMASHWTGRELDRFVIVPTVDAADTTRWVRLSECGEEDLVWEVQAVNRSGFDRMLVKGHVTNTSPFTVFEYTVHVDLFDLRNSFSGSVQAKWSHDGLGEPFAPGKRRDFEVSTDAFRQPDINTASIRAIGRVR